MGGEARCDTPNKQGLGNVQGQGTKGKAKEIRRNEDSNIEQQESGFEKADPRFTWWTSRMTSNTTYGYMTSMRSIVDQAVNSRPSSQ